MRRQLGRKFNADKLRKLDTARTAALVALRAIDADCALRVS